MAHFAQLNESNVVVEVMAVHNNELLVNGVESEQKGIEFCTSLLGGRWVQTSYNNNFRKRYAGIGYTFDSNLNVFIPPKPFPSWLLDMQEYNWKAPVPYPENESPKKYLWSEDITNWVLLPEKPYPSWVLNHSTVQWEPPVPYPNNGEYYWDELDQIWRVQPTPAPSPE